MRCESVCEILEVYSLGFLLCVHRFFYSFPCQAEELCLDAVWDQRCCYIDKKGNDYEDQRAYRGNAYEEYYRLLERMGLRYVDRVIRETWIGLHIFLTQEL